jgi:hypothetical protein
VQGGVLDIDAESLAVKGIASAEAATDRHHRRRQLLGVMEMTASQGG